MTLNEDLLYWVEKTGHRKKYSQFILLDISVTCLSVFSCKKKKKSTLKTRLISDGEDTYKCLLAILGAAPAFLYPFVYRNKTH